MVHLGPPTVLWPFLKNRGSLAIFFAEEIAHLGASKSRAISPGAVNIAAAAAENRAILVHSGRGARKLPISVNGAFPLLNGPFSDLNGRFPECLNGTFSLSNMPWKTALS